GAVGLGMGAAGKGLGGVVGEAETLSKAGRAAKHADDVAEHVDAGAARRAMAHLPKEVPDQLPAFPTAAKVKSKATVQGGGHRRRRWVDDEGRIYEWDSRHGTVEVYGKNGRHRGEFDYKTGEQLKPADPMRKAER
ncbi:MAG: hypothetical protein JNM83_26115, partial [Myxococcales bacterium]|nr:hypothetical protein [Myxococcales bacterium]